MGKENFFIVGAVVRVALVGSREEDAGFGVEGLILEGEAGGGEGDGEFGAAEAPAGCYRDFLGGGHCFWVCGYGEGRGRFVARLKGLVQVSKRKRCLRRHPGFFNKIKYFGWV